MIVGAGFGGLWAARTLAGAPVDLLLIDRRNHHTFLPLPYQVAAAELEPAEIAYPVRSILRSVPNSQFILRRKHLVHRPFVFLIGLLLRDVRKAELA